jgi:outer membrane receptor protein involved in Fe transport
VDGVYQQNTSYLNSPTLAVEQIEVLRGPQSTLFGQNTLGGAINVTTRQPSGPAIRRTPRNLSLATIATRFSAWRRSSRSS